MAKLDSKRNQKALSQKETFHCLKKDDENYVQFDELWFKLRYCITSSF